MRTTCQRAVIAALLVLGAGLGLSPAAATSATSGDRDKLQDALDRQGLPTPQQVLSNLPAEMLSNPSGSAKRDERDFGTPTRAPGKVCPHKGDIDVSLPLVNSPVGSSLPGLAGATLEEPSIPASVYGELCMSKETLAEARRGNPPAVLLMVHGITYGTWYWDSPFQPERYSVVNRLIDRGYATLNIDRIGQGRSSHPISPAVTADTNAESVHQLIQRLRDGDVGGIDFDTVGLVSHSYGTVTSWLETAKHNDADAVISTGYSNRLATDAAVNLFSGLMPAAAQPMYKGKSWALDPGYFSFRPGSRVDTPFFYKPNMDPEFYGIDERLQNPVTIQELLTLVPRAYDGTHKNIDTPLFIINGEHDSFFCGPRDLACATTAKRTDGPRKVERLSQAFTEWEGTGFSSKACLRSAVIPDMAHNLSMHRSSAQATDQIAYFADQALGSHGQNADEYHRRCAGRTSAGTSEILPEVNRLIPPLHAPFS